jgi:hypothetical protein
MKLFTKYFDENKYSIMQSMQILNSSYPEGVRGLIFFPKNLIKKTKETLLNDNEIYLHMSCLNHESIDFVFF